ncbi:hypothetical protein EVJ58_g318 [Rhodofomes roseus]|uniref:PH domain-containing protein n=1 Tax=Rhodofomes roseus TaxID=34475 RepID=A0A4Y9Z4X5_9APHY|nr:hypothetical protein EVJ58_g318 [Rhodofomes roseus]
MDSVEGRSNAHGVHDPLYQVKLLSALRSGDPARIHTFLSALNKDSRKSVESDHELGATALHLAIRCASTDTVALLLAHRAISPNAVHPPGTGTTALHLAASIARVDVINLLLDQDGIDDTLRDSQGRTCLDVAKGKETIRAIQDSRAYLTASYRSLLRTYILSAPADPPPDDLIKLLSLPRIRHVDLSYLDESSGRTLLHEAVRRKDLRLVELAVRAGADVFVRDRHGKALYDSAGKDDRVKAFLRQFTNQDPSLLKPTSDSEPPELKGYLNKYTNVAKGYNTRWFVLKNGVLSYYRHQEDESIASRGSIAMKTAALHVSPGNSGLRFEVHSTGVRGAQKWYLKANHRVEAARWTQALQKAVEYARHEGENERKSGESDVPSLPSFSGGTSIRGTLVSTHVSRAKLADSIHHSAASSTLGAETESGDDVPSKHEKSLKESSDERDEEHESFAESEGKILPHNNSFELQGSTLVAQVELASDLVSKMPVPDPSPKAIELRRAVEDTLQSVHGMLVEYVQMVKDREDWWKAKLERERERQNLWEESLQLVVQDSQTLESELRKQSRRRSRMESSYVSAMTHVDSGGTIKARSPQLASPMSESASSFSVQTPTSPPPTPGLGVGMIRRPISRQASATSPIQSIMAASAARAFSATGAPPTADDDTMVDTDEEDEFFDAIESNNLPNLVVKPVISDHLWITIHRDQYLGYLKLRQRLAIDNDDRPPMSLWAVLKNSIGKDLTKISFPVFFNEPTSMLQRMAEDMEFSECLDSAHAETDAHRRIAYVAAFAMSNYSSTIGRIAKPFNPMLGESFEYVSLDKDYRYMSEQVSHHPPMSACWAESPHWRYYGEVDAQNKFMGKSFEIRPTGVAHAELLLPKERAPNYPVAKGPHAEGRVVEHFSWKKVTTNISGFILGSPTIDHYGDMVVTNHRTGDKCVLTFKPRGWRGKDAFEICGYVSDVHGNVTYEIAGRWNSQLVARAVGTGIGQLHPDVKVGGQDSSVTPEYILLWRNSEKPAAPFNLTPFAVTLNDCPDTLGPYVAPTDCRLRPDQRAFELGKYERANELKNKQEEFQRATRKAREEGRAPPHRPRWFSAETEPDTGERVWAPSTVNGELEYWIERDKVWDSRHVGQVTSWKNVDRIFIEDQP